MSEPRTALLDKSESRVQTQIKDASGGTYAVSGGRHKKHENQDRIWIVKKLSQIKAFPERPAKIAP